MVTQLKVRPTPRFSPQEHSALYRAFAGAVNQTGTAFSHFTHPAWDEFFALATPTWAPPKPAKISTQLLADDYASAMLTMRDELASAAAVTVGVDGATNVHSRTMNNVLAFDTRPWFVEYLRPGSGKETAVWLASSITDAVSRLNNFVGKRVVSAFVSDSCNAM